MVSIRSARRADEAALRALDLATWTAEVSPPAPSDPTDSFFNDATLPADVLVADQGGTVVGYVRLSQQGPLGSHDHVLMINGLAVAPDHQGAGLGRALVQAALDRAQSRAARKVSLRVLAPNVRARSVYEACGFVVEGVLRGEFLLQGKFVDDVFMAHHLEK